MINIVSFIKKDSKDKPGTHWSVSPTSVVGKLLEEILRDRIYQQLERHIVISDSLCGFEHGK